MGNNAKHVRKRAATAPKYTLNGEPVSILKLAEILHTHYTTLYKKAQSKGIPLQEVIDSRYAEMQAGKVNEKAPMTRGQYAKWSLNGERLTIVEISKRLYVGTTVLYRRSKRHGTTMQEEIDREWRRQHGR